MTELGVVVVMPTRNWRREEGEDDTNVMILPIARVVRVVPVMWSFDVLVFKVVVLVVIMVIEAVVAMASTFEVLVVVLVEVVVG
eukprot:6017135-Pyramimonas_sp.AAC.1